jgi:hypothetical protein
MNSSSSTSSSLPVGLEQANSATTAEMTTNISVHLRKYSEALREALVFAAEEHAIYSLNDDQNLGRVQRQYSQVWNLTSTLENIQNQSRFFITMLRMRQSHNLRTFERHVRQIDHAVSEDQVQHILMTAPPISALTIHAPAATAVTTTSPTEVRARSIATAVHRTPARSRQAPVRVNRPNVSRRSMPTARPSSPITVPDVVNEDNSWLSVRRRPASFPDVSSSSSSSSSSAPVQEQIDDSPSSVKCAIAFCTNTEDGFAAFIGCDHVVCSVCYGGMKAAALANHTNRIKCPLCRKSRRADEEDENSVLEHRRKRSNVIIELESSTEEDEGESEDDTRFL